MGKDGPVFVINPPLLQASQASSGSATIPGTAIRLAVPHTASLTAPEGQVATPRRLREGRRARRRAGSAGVGQVIWDVIQISKGEGVRRMRQGQKNKSIRNALFSHLPLLQRGLSPTVVVLKFFHTFL